MLIDMEILRYLDADFIQNFVNLENLGQNFDEETVRLISPKILKALCYQAKLESKFTELTVVEDSKTIKTYNFLHNPIFTTTISPPILSYKPIQPWTSNPRTASPSTRSSLRRWTLKNRRVWKKRSGSGRRKGRRMQTSFRNS